MNYKIVFAYMLCVIANQAPPAGEFSHASKDSGTNSSNDKMQHADYTKAFNGFSKLNFKMNDLLSNTEWYVAELLGYKDDVGFETCVNLTLAKIKQICSNLSKDERSKAIRPALIYAYFAKKSHFIEDLIQCLDTALQSLANSQDTDIISIYYKISDFASAIEDLKSLCGNDLTHIPTLLDSDAEVSIEDAINKAITLSRYISDDESNSDLVQEKLEFKSSLVDMIKVNFKPNYGLYIDKLDTVCTSDWGLLIHKMNDLLDLCKQIETQVCAIKKKFSPQDEWTQLTEYCDSMKSQVESFELIKLQNLSDLMKIASETHNLTDVIQLCTLIKKQVSLARNVSHAERVLALSKDYFDTFAVILHLQNLSSPVFDLSAQDT